MWALPVLVTLAIGGLGFYYFRHGNRRNRIVFDPTAQQLMASSYAGEFEVKYASDSVSDPYIATVQFWNEGPKDIRKADFDQPLRISIGARIVAIVDQQEDRFGALEVSKASDTVIEIAPTLPEGFTAPSLAPPR